MLLNERIAISMSSSLSCIVSKALLPISTKKRILAGLQVLSKSRSLLGNV